MQCQIRPRRGGRVGSAESFEFLHFCGPLARPWLFPLAPRKRKKSCKKFQVVQTVVNVTTVCTRPGAGANRRNFHDGLHYVKLLAKNPPFSQREREKLRCTKGNAEIDEIQQEIKGF